MQAEKEAKEWEWVIGCHIEILTAGGMVFRTTILSSL